MLMRRVYAGGAGVQRRGLSWLRPDDWGVAAADDRWRVGYGDTELVCGEVWAYRAGGSYSRRLRQCGVDCSDSGVSDGYGGDWISDSGLEAAVEGTDTR